MGSLAFVDVASGSCAVVISDETGVSSDVVALVVFVVIDVVPFVGTAVVTEVEVVIVDFVMLVDAN